MRLSATRKRSVVDTSAAETVGTVRGAVLDPSERRLTAVIVDGSDNGSLVSWADTAGFGPDAVTVTSTDALRLPQTDREEATVGGDLDVLGKPVFDDAGDRLGKLRDLEFDPESGAVHSLVVDDGETVVEGDRLLGVGSYCVVVKAATS